MGARLAFLCAVGLIVSPIARTQEADDGCTEMLQAMNCIDPVSHPTSGSPDGASNAFPAGRFDIAFRSYRARPGLSTCIVKPLMSFSPDNGKLEERVAGLVRSKLREIVDQAGLGLQNFWFKSRSASGKSLQLQYGVTVEKIALYKWLCCSDWSCSFCERPWKVWEKSGDINVSLVLQSNEPTPEDEKQYSASIDVFRGSRISQSIKPKPSLGMGGDAKPDFSYGDLEKLADLFLGAIEISLNSLISVADRFAIPAKPIKYDDRIHMQLIDLFRKIPSSAPLGSGLPSLESPASYLTDNSCSIGFDKKLNLRTGVHAADFSKVCTALAGAFRLDVSSSGVDERSEFKFNDTFDVDAYRKLAGDDAATSGILNHGLFCLKNDKDPKGLNFGRRSYSDFLDRLVTAIEGSKPKNLMLPPYNNIGTDLRDFYGLDGLETFIATQTENEKLRRAAAKSSWAPLHVRRVGKLGIAAPDSPLKPDELTGTAIPSLKEVISSAGIIPAGGSLAKLSAYEEWSEAERNCARKLARLLTGSETVVYQGMSFGRCLGSRDSPNRVAAVRRAVAIFNNERDQFNSSELALATANPLDGDLSYRGWYYCSRNPTICNNPSSVTWWQYPSTYASRGGRQRGIDIFSTTRPNNLMAFATGVLTYVHDRDGWGHTLLLAFNQGGKDYVAVYANLPPAIRLLDSRRVRAGDALGVTSECSRGDHQGSCNTFCRTEDGVKASDDHLHFEILDPTTCDKGTCTGVDPSMLRNMSVRDNRRREVYACEKVNPLTRVTGKTVRQKPVS
jgi:hypothetical protein